jgi:NAD-dependent dihydropyrimidine dehydrogenase PreA subunit
MIESNGPWFPIIFSDKCDGCAKTGNPRCVEYCSNDVFAFQGGKAVVLHPEKCLSGCSACESVCHAKAIQFPRRTSSFNVNARGPDREDMIRKTVCPKCKKTYWTNRKTDVCFDCENQI